MSGTFEVYQTTYLILPSLEN